MTITNPTHAGLSFNHLADHERAVVMVDRITRYQSILAWLVHGDDQQAMHVANNLTDEELAIAAISGERLSSLAAMVLGARAALPEDVGGVVVGAGARRAI